MSLTRSTLAVLICLGSVGVAGCMRPLYAPDATLVNNRHPGRVAAALRAIDIPPMSTRMGQVLRNELIFSFHGDGGQSVNPRYRLVLTLKGDSEGVTVVQYRGAPQSRVMTLRAAYQLKDTATGDILHDGHSFAQSSWNWSAQRFANERALREAETRAAKAIAADLRTRIAAYFADHEPLQNRQQTVHTKGL